MNRLPSDCKDVSYEFLAQLVGEHIPPYRRSCPMPLVADWTRAPIASGHGIQPSFHISHPVLASHDRWGICPLRAPALLLHRWLINPESSEYAAMSCVKDYDLVVNLIVEADILTRGLLVDSCTEEDGDSAGSGQARPSNSNINLTDEERREVDDAVAILTFLESTTSQLTYPDLCTLSSLPPQSTDFSQSAST
ncbi:hypothetical protein BC827DRAFT_1272783 [Russula dissimulans]|nr:hypothetical protein BC827DRAFT_1272783 [Russula dissimulans]